MLEIDEPMSGIPEEQFISCPINFNRDGGIVYAFQKQDYYINYAELKLNSQARVDKEKNPAVITETR